MDGIFYFVYKTHMPRLELHGPDPDGFDPRLRLLLSHLTVVNSSWNQDNYSSPYWRLYWNPSSGASLHFQKRVYPLTPECPVLIPPDTPFGASASRPTRHLHMHFLAEEPLRTAQPGIYPVTHPRSVLPRLKQLLSLHQSGTRRPRFLSLLSLSIICEALATFPEKALMPTGTDPRLAKIMKAMEHNIATPLDNSALASLAGMNVNAFIRFFRQTVGTTPQDWYARRRIDRACLMLHHTDMKIDRIAQDSGFCDRYHFTRVFRQVRGLGPATYRKQALLSRKPSP